MKQRVLWKISVTTTPQAEDAVSQLLESAFGQPASSYTDAETGGAVVSVYVPTRPDWSKARQKELALGVRKIGGSGLELGPGQIALKRIDNEDWAESWKLHFRPLVIGSALLLNPSWSRRRPRKGQPVVVYSIPG